MVRSDKNTKYIMYKLSVLNTVFYLGFFDQAQHLALLYLHLALLYLHLALLYPHLALTPVPLVAHSADDRRLASNFMCTAWFPDLPNCWLLLAYWS